LRATKFLETGGNIQSLRVVCLAGIVVCSLAFEETLSTYRTASSSFLRSTSISGLSLYDESKQNMVGKEQKELPSKPGWYELADTQLEPHCPEDPGIAGNTGCKAVISAWNGGVADTKRNRLILWGGGHTDYFGNEIYALDLNTLTFVRLNDSSTPAGTCVAANANGTPNSRHTYGGLAYLSQVDRMFVKDGSLACAAGSSALDTWMLDLSNVANPTEAWQRMDPVNVAGTVPDNTGLGTTSDYDPNTQLTYVGDNSSLFSYNYATNTYTKLGSLNPGDYHLTGVIDYGRKLYLIVGNGQGLKADIDPRHTFSSTYLKMTNCGLMKSASYPGLAYDPTNKEVVGWAGGDTVYLYNPETDSCTSQTYRGGPGTQQTNGTFGRFRYFPALRVFALVNGWQQDAFVLRLATPATLAAQDFQNRCNAKGVVFCQGFDEASGFQQNVNIYSNSSYPGVFPVKDSATGRSGTSLRIDIPPFQGANAGKFDSAFPGIGGKGADFYFQVATRISPEMLSNYKNFGWPTWKNHGFFNGNTSCTGLMVVTGLHNSGLIPVGTTGGCSSNGLFTNRGVPPYLLQQGDYNCQYRGIDSKTCFHWPTNTWITFYYHIKLGTLDASGNFPGTLVEAWVATNGQPYKKWISLTNFYFVGNGAGAPFNHVELYPYMTGKDATQGGYPAAHVWYDELIISTQPIAAPAVPPALP